jgi:alpha-beta hydrolase superfamily lysophospholipase
LRRLSVWEYFPKNYVWNLSINIAASMGGSIGEVDAVCRSLIKSSEASDDSGTVEFFHAWCDQAQRLAELAAEDLAGGRHMSASAKYGRAALYYITAERMQHPDFAPRRKAYGAMLDCFSKHIEAGRLNCERVEIPYQGKSLAALYISASAADPGAPPAPCIVFCNGLDSTKEMIYGSRISHELLRRGVSTLIVDQPGVGEALRLQNLPAIVEAEQWAGACADALERRGDVDARFLGICGWSLGGFYAPRAVAFEKRFKLCVAWGANFNWGELQKRRAAREGDNPVPHYWGHVQWVWGKKSFKEFIEFAPRITLADSIDKITVPFLVTHGSNDRQIPREYAIQEYEGAINSPKRELKWFTSREGGIEHISIDNPDNARDYIADWITETFRELGAGHLAL